MGVEKSDIPSELSDDDLDEVKGGGIAPCYPDWVSTYTEGLPADHEWLGYQIGLMAGETARKS